MNIKRVAVSAVVLGICIPIVLILYSRFWQPALSPLPILIARFNTPHSGLLQIAEAKGYFVEEGLHATIKTIPTGPEVIAQVLRGEVDVGTSAETPIALALANGKKFKIIATIFSSKSYIGVVARKDLGITSPAGLRGKRVGFVFGTASHYQLETFLALYNIPFDALTLVPLKPDVLVAALVAGEVDAISIWAPYITKAQQQLGGDAQTFLPKELYPQMTNLIVRADYVKNNREATDRLLRALLKAENFAQTHPEKAIAIIAAASGISTSELRSHSDPLAYELTLKQSLLLAMENEVRWGFQRGIVPEGPFPDVLHAFETEPLSAIKPAGVTILR